MKRTLFFMKRGVQKTSLSFLLLFSVCTIQAQSGSSLVFDGTAAVDLPNILTASYTKEAWFYSPLTGGAINNNNIVSGTATAFWAPGTQGYRLSAGHSFPFNAVQDPTPLEANRWYHVAVTYDAATTTMNLYKNGVLVSSNNAVAGHLESSLAIGSFIGANYMVGQLDEVRVWSVALSQSEIRDWMCQTVTASHPQWANLLGYYKANENAGTTVGDSKNSNNGTINGAGVTWGTSGAAIGAASVHDFVNATKTASITYAGTGESFTATSTSGSPDGIVVYRVDQAPTNVSGLLGLGNNNKYFGVFQCGGTSPQYTAVYNYNNTIFTPDETVARLYKRANNSTSTWVDASATQNTTANTLTVTGESTEYVLGSSGFSLPVTISSFNAQKQNTAVQLTWTTSNESNNSGFVVQRSVNAGLSWTDLGFVAGAGNSSAELNYLFTDRTPVKGVNTYRIKQVDLDQRYTLSPVRLVNFSSAADYSIYPVPATSSVTINVYNKNLLNTTLSVLDVNGRIMKQVQLTESVQQLPVQDLSKGVYILRFANGTVSRIIKQ